MFSEEKGLSTEEVKVKNQKYGLNVLPEKPPPSILELFIRQIRNPLIYVLLSAGLVTIVMGHYSDAVIILLAVLINTILGFLQERKASNALYALKHFVTNTVTVVRNGQRDTIDTSALVPGDIVILNQGTKVPADGRLISVNRLYLDESLLTGESVSVEKEEKDPIYMGTIVASGQGVMAVEKTGADTKMGAIALQIQETEADTPLQRQLKHFSKQLVVIVLSLTALVFIVGIVRQFEIAELFTTSVALAVSSIPEGLIVSLTVVLAIGMQKILKRRGLVRKLAAAETLGGVTVICVDKTGTITQGKMEVVDYIGDKKELAEQVLLANDLDDPIVIASFEWGRKIIDDFVDKHGRLDSIPFSSKERFFISLHKWTENKNRIYVNGAPELILEWTTLSETEKKELLSTINDLTNQGKRLLGFARKDVELDKLHLTNGDAKKDLTWVGLLAFSDPVRLGVKEALIKAQEAGIHTIVITGDYAKTSQFVLAQLGMNITQDEILTGEELEKLNTRELSQRVKKIRLFARTTPDQKLMIVKALKDNGEVVAMMGDGVNDAPALHASDIGIAVGEATDVAKESAHLVLLDSNFSTIVAAVEEGRAMFDNIRKIVLYLMSDAFGEIIVVLGSMLLGLPLSITAVQILWINLVSDGFPNLSLAIDPKREDIMKEKPRSPKERLVNTWMISLIGIVSLVAGFMALSVYAVIYTTTGDVVLARSMAFLTLGLNSLSYVFSVRALMTPFWKSHPFQNKWLIIAVAAGFVLQAVPFSTETLRNFFGIKNLEPQYWIISIGLSISVFFIVELFKFLYSLKHKNSV